MDFRRLQRFVKIVDVGSLSRAADALRIAQPALSQQLASLEAEFQQQLLVRSKRGVVPTQAGAILYRHAQAILKQLDQARSDVSMAGQSLSGNVSVGLGGIGASAIAMPLLQTVRARHPGIVLYVNDSFGTTLSELVMVGRMDMAVVYGDRDTRGLSLEPLLHEPLCIVARRGAFAPAAQIRFADLAETDLLLPRTFNYVRRLLDRQFERVGITPRIVAEIEAAPTLASAVAAGIGAAILPISAARAVSTLGPVVVLRIEDPIIDVPLVMCTSDTFPLTVPASVVKNILTDLVHEMTQSHPFFLPDISKDPARS